ncbi:hypothetical protein PG991_012178 [Apiospora marii]|uniref:Uncharacterized protein n=1 Tax=Apiospora marii TaxID=335849 RepID=A0ABR1R961_9PEZI
MSERANAVANDQAVQNQANIASSNDASAAHTSMPQTPSNLSYSTTAPWMVDPAITNNGLGSQHASSLQYLSAPDGNSNVWTDATADPNHQIGYSYGQNDQAQWSALNNYANAPPRMTHGRPGS